MANEHGEILSKDGNPQHVKTCFSQVIDEDNSDQTLTEWRAEVAAALANAGSGGTTYTAGDGISISEQNAISVDGDWLDAKGYATSSDLTSATSGLATTEAVTSAISEATASLATQSALETLQATVENLQTRVAALESAGDGEE